LEFSELDLGALPITIRIFELLAAVVNAAVDYYEKWNAPH